MHSEHIWASSPYGALEAEAIAHASSDDEDLLALLSRAPAPRPPFGVYECPSDSERRPPFLRSHSGVRFCIWTQRGSRL